MSGIYIHIPFCKQACSYCDFYFVTRDRLIPEFVDALVREIHALPVDDGCPFPSDPVRTLYFGGGTPSRLSAKQLRRLMDALHRKSDLSHLAECTIEVNPEDVTTEWLQAVREMGVTRLSMGIQTFQPELLAFMHRAHSADQAHRALELVGSAGFHTYSVDLIYGCPDQTMDQLNDDLHQLLVYRPPHVSAYSLTIEPRTRLGRQADLGRLNPADDEHVSKQAAYIRQTLASSGIDQYEISNYAAPGHEAVHNSAYWCHENYLGMGPAAHSFYWPPGRDQQGLAFRWFHPPDIHAYLHMTESGNFRTGSAIISALEKLSHSPAVASSWTAHNTIPGSEPHPKGSPATAQTGVTPDYLRITPEGIAGEILTRSTLANERLMTGLRTVQGIDPRELKSRYGYTPDPLQQSRIAALREKGWMEPDDPLRLTARGFELADAITLDLLD